MQNYASKPLETNEIKSYKEDEKRAKEQQMYFEERKATEANEFDEELFEEIEYEECTELFDLLDDILVDEYHLIHSTTIMLQFLKEHTIMYVLLILYIC